jgi:DNA-binding NarL/FixJ family response regulator
MSERIRILIVDGDASFRRAACAALHEADGLAVVGEAANRTEAVSLAHDLCPDVILLDTKVLRPNGAQGMEQINRSFPASRIVVLGLDEHDPLALSVLRQGAWGYVIKGELEPGELAEAVRVVSRGGTILSPRMAGWILDEIISNRACSRKGRESAAQSTSDSREALHRRGQGD